MVLQQPDLSTTTTPPTASRPSDDWFRRVAAVLLDGAILGAVTWLAVGSLSVVPTLQPPFAGGLLGGSAGETAAWARSPWVIATVVVLLLLQAFTGATPGKRLVGVLVVRVDTGAPAGLWRTLARPVLHLLDALLFIGYLRPLWNDRRQTFADSILGTHVVVSRSPMLPAWLAARWGSGSPRRSRLVTAAAGVVCALGLGLSFPISRVAAEPTSTPAECDVVGVGANASALAPRASVTHQISHMFERRLWIEREVATSPVDAVVQWSWASGVAAVDGAEQEAWLRSSARPEQPDGSTSWALEPTALAGRLTADLWLDDESLRDVGADGWVESTLVIDGEAAATCTVSGTDLGLR